MRLSIREKHINTNSYFIELNSIKIKDLHVKVKYKKHLVENIREYLCDVGVYTHFLERAQIAKSIKENYMAKSYFIRILLIERHS